MLIKKIYKNTKGDTIIEVLLSIAVMSLILVVSYGLSSRSSQYIQQSQEHGEAQKIGEQQLELLRKYLTADTNWDSSDYICFKEADATHPPQPTTVASDCDKGIDGRYQVTITVTDSNGDGEGDTYNVNTHWASLTSEADQSVDLSYKLPASLLTVDEFLLDPGSTVTVVAKKIPQRAPNNSAVATSGSANPSCSDSGRIDKAGTSVEARYIDIHGNAGPWQSNVTNGASTNVFSSFEHYGKYQSRVNVDPATYDVCSTNPQQNMLLSPATNLTFNYVIKPKCTITNDYVRTDAHPIYATGWVQDVPHWDNVASWGWNYSDWFWWSYWPPGYGSVNSPYNTVFQSGGNQLVLREVRYGHPNENYRYEHYVWGITGWSWQITGWDWRSYQYISSYWYENIYELRNHCPA